MDLRTEIQEELQNNPALEELPMEGVSLDQENSEPEESTSDNPDEHDPTREEMNFSNFKLGSVLGALFF